MRVANDQFRASRGSVIPVVRLGFSEANASTPLFRLAIATRNFSDARTRDGSFE